MSKFEMIAELKGNLQKVQKNIDKIILFHEEFLNNRSNMPSGKPYDLIVLADIFADFYTCAETGFVRISKFFENNLEKDRWHSQLLEKMTIEIPGIRPSALSEQTESGLRELLKFRHFKRYYFQFEYDRDRIDFLEKKFKEIIPLLQEDFSRFFKFLDQLQ
jgi:hypothetical protein